MAAICARILALWALRTLGLSKILRSSFMVLLDRSEAGPVKCLRRKCITPMFC